jgi:uncharacterized protein YciI
LSAPPRLRQPRAAEQYGFVTLLGNDTVSVERIARSPTRLVAEGVDRWPFVRRRHTEFDLAADGSIRRMVMDVRTPNGRPAWTAEVTPANEALQQAHASYLMKLGETGALLMAGPLSAHPTAEEIRGLVILRAKACGDVAELFARDPKVKAGFLVADVLAWQVPTFMVPRIADVASLPPPVPCLRG